MLASANPINISGKKIKMGNFAVHISLAKSAYADANRIARIQMAICVFTID